MPNYTTTVPSTWTQEQTFAYLADFRNVAEWDPGIDSSTLTSGEAGRQGAVYEVVMTTLGRETRIPYVAEQVQAPSRIVLRGETDSFISVDTITVAPDGAVTYDAQVELKGVRKVAEPLAQLGFNRAGSKASEGLEEKLSASRL